jgi:hypothetical protein
LAADACISSLPFLGIKLSCTLGGIFLGNPFFSF